MIYVNKHEVSEKEFLSLLEVTKREIETELKGKGLPAGMNGESFEDLVFSQMVKSAIGTEFEGHVEQTGAHAFPDIIARKLYGVEVKMTIGDKWVSTGNSVLETTRVEDVKTIYLFFGKFGDHFEAKYRKYEECMYEVGVTHSPRYKIDMNLPNGKSIFDKLGVSYETFRQEKSPIKRLKKYYRDQLKEGEELWWIDPTAEDVSVSPVIKSFKSLDESEKEKFTNEVMVLFPEIFGNSTVKFERAAAYLITNYNAVSSSLRDNFTAGGQVKIKLGKKKITVQRLCYNLFLRAKQVKITIENTPREKLADYWKIDIEGSPLNTWLGLLEKYSGESGEKTDAVAVFDEGLKNE